MECSRSGAIAYFEQDDNQFYFTYFEGKKNCLLYYFFLGCYKLQEGYYQDLELKDRYPLSLVFPKSILWFHDFISPFFRLVRSEYILRYTTIDDYISPSKIRLESGMQNLIGKRKLNSMNFSIDITTSGIEKLKIQEKETNIEMERCNN